MEDDSESDSVSTDETLINILNIYNFLDDNYIEDTDKCSKNKCDKRSLDILKTGQFTCYGRFLESGERRTQAAADVSCKRF